MMVGFFMIMVDSTIVAVANPTIMAELHTGYDAVIWVTSAYLLGYAAVLLVAGRLGDRFGPKNLYVIGLVVFILASLWCGLSDSATVLISARLVQGLGAGVLTPQTLATVTRVFPAEQRGVAIGAWGATAGAAMLVGPLAGGALLDGLGWRWIFFVNVPVGVAGLALAVWLVPVLSTQSHRFDLIGVGLSGAGVVLVVYGLQHGEAVGWQPCIWAIIIAGIGLLTTFCYWESVTPGEPLVPPEMFQDRNFGLCTLGVAIMSFSVTAMLLPLTFYAQAVCGLSPMHTALLIAPMAIANGVLAPVAGRIVDRSHPRAVVGLGFSLLAIALTWLSFEMSSTTTVWRLILPMSAIGAAMAVGWQALAATATRNLPVHLAGAGSAVYNTIRQLGAVLGSAGTAAYMTWRIDSQTSSYTIDSDDVMGVQLPKFMLGPFSDAMSQTMLLPGFAALFGIIAALFLLGLAPSAKSHPVGRPDPAHSGDDDSPADDDFDNDGFVELTLPGAAYEPEMDTLPLPTRVSCPHLVAAAAGHRRRAQPRACNGFHADASRRFWSLIDFLDAHLPYPTAPPRENSWAIEGRRRLQRRRRSAGSWRTLSAF
ncbi:MFS transporter [Mycobacterium simiae]|uniref:MFS transporter n=1 Tax=Mycobacterium simiae TaxID=1784 RepID=A0A1X0XS96_MYCSI|nr:MFS transporter [Mycobacterium simiae]ORJ55781.1 MFS transporter [Mycobacterium simiae]